MGDGDLKNFSFKSKEYGVESKEWSFESEVWSFWGLCKKIGIFL